MIDNDELDAWLYEVETTSQKVKDILSGKIDVKRLDEEERIKKEKKEKAEALKKFKEEEMKRKEEERIRNGRKGPGSQDNYEKFCRFCHFEYENKDFTNCTHCKKELITREERKKELKGKVENLKQEKAKKKFRRAKYENWIKTESIVKTRTFRNYEKWQMYESSSDEDENTEPILPKDDPNFKALEKDMIETQKARDLAKNKAIKLKEEGNQMMKEGKFKKAIRLYSEAIEECRGMMVLYSNRALAYIRVDEYDNAVKDCDKIIEYLDIFEEEMKKNQDLYVKALCRKAQATMKLKNFDSAIECIESAKALSEDEEINKLHKLIMIEHEVYKKSLEVFNTDSPVYKKVDFIFDELRDSVATNSDEFKKKYIDNKKNLDDLIKEFKKEENLKLYFIKKGGLELLFTFMKKFPELLDLLEIFNNEEKYIIQINNIKGYNKLVNILFLSDESSQNFKLNHFRTIVGILEDSSQVEIVRKTLSQMKNFQKLFMASFTKFDITLKETRENKDFIIILMHFFTFICNICYSSPEIRKQIAQDFSIIIEKVNIFSKEFKLDNILNKNLLETILSFLTNMSCENEFRIKLVKEESFIAFLINQLKSINLLCSFTEEMVNIESNLSNKKSKNKNKDDNKFAYFDNFKDYEDLFEKIICLLFNVSFKDENNYLYVEKGLSDPLIFFIEKIFGVFYKEENRKYLLDNKKDFFKEFNQITLLRVLMIIGKVTKNLSVYSDLQLSNIFNPFLNNDAFYQTIFDIINIDLYKTNSKIIDNNIKIVAHLFTYINNLREKTRNISTSALPSANKIDPNSQDLIDKNLDIILSEANCEKLLLNLSVIFTEDYKNLEKESERIINTMSLINSIITFMPNKSLVVKPIVKYVINIAKDKLDLLRKNAAILLAKIAKSSEEMEKVVRDLHGIDVIMNVAKFIKIEK